MSALVVKILILLIYSTSFYVIPLAASTSADETGKTLVRQKVVTMFADDAETFTRIVYFLDREEKGFSENAISPVWKTLIAASESEHLFEKYVNRLVEDTKSAEEDAKYKVLMSKIWREIMEPSDEPRDISSSQGFKMDIDIKSLTASGGLAKSWSMISAKTQEEILMVIGQVIDRTSMITVKQFASSIKTIGGDVVMIGLAAVNMGYEAWNNMNRWWKGEISGVRCAKNLIDSFVSISAGVFGGFAGATYGSSFGPLGTIIGGVTGSLLGSHTTMLFSDYLTQKIFSIPKSEALENAYNYFGVSMTASNEEINTKYREYSIWHHPDKGGRDEDFYVVQIQMGIIRLARGESTNY